MFQETHVKTQGLGFRFGLGAVLFGVILVVAFSAFSAKTQVVNSASALTSEGDKMTVGTGFYCNTKALNKAERERYNQLTTRLAQARIETKELPDGYAFRLESEEVALSDVAEWISAERKCCPFFSFEIELQRDSGPLWLKLKGAEGIKAFIRAEFGIR